MAPTISVITTVYNKEKTVSDCISSILTQNYQDFEMIIVNDGSTDRSAARIANFLDNDRIKTFQTNHSGHSRAKNSGARAATGEIFYFIDADCIAESACLSNLKFLFDQSDLGCIGGEVRAINENHLLPKAIEIWENPPPQPPGANVAYRREVFEKAGGFDEQMQFGEDVDLYWRVAKLGFKCSIEPTVRVRVLHPQTIPDFLRQRFRWGIGYAQLMERHPEKIWEEQELSFRFFSLAILSCLLILIDLRLVIVFVALDLVIVVRYVFLGRRLARDRGAPNFWWVLAVIKLLDAVAYYLGYYYWRLLKPFRGRRAQLHSDPIGNPLPDIIREH